MVFNSFRKLLISFSVFVLVVLLILWYTFSNLRSQELELQKISHSRQVLQVLGPALADMQAFEAIRANYITTHDEKWTNDHRSALSELRTDSIALNRLAQKDPAYGRLLHLTHEMISLGESGNAEVNGKTGITITREFQVLVDKLEDQNRQILNTSYANSIRLTRQTFTFVKIISAVLILVVGISFVMIYRDKRRQVEKEKAEAQIQAQKLITRAVLRAEERARNKFGQELHDNVNQILASTKLFLNMAREKAGDKDDELLVNTGKLLDNAINEIRLLSQNQVTPLRGVDLEEMIESMIEKLNQSSNLSIEFTYDPSTAAIDDELKLNIYRIVQEQISNIVKHSNAASVQINIEKQKDLLHVLINDDGRGFNTSKRRNGIGLSNMINRIESFNGELEIESSEGHGCRLHIKVPC